MEIATIESKEESVYTIDVDDMVEEIMADLYESIKLPKKKLLVRNRMKEEADKGVLAYVERNVDNIKSNLEVVNSLIYGINITSKRTENSQSDQHTICTQ